MVCPVCGGDGHKCKGEDCEKCKQGSVPCSECQDGRIIIDCCPLELVTNDIWEVMEYAQLYEKGLPPVAGGALDQAQIFLDACRTIFSLEKYARKKLGIK